MTPALYRAGVWETVRSELGAAPSRMGGAQGMLLAAAFVGGLGVWLPWRMGFEILDPFLQLVYAMFAPLFQQRITVESFAEDKNRRMLEGWWDPPCPQPEFLLGKLIATAVLGWAGALATQAACFVTLRAAHGQGNWILPDGSLLASALSIGAAFSLFCACAGAALALQVQTPAEARRSVRGMFLAFLALLLLFGPYAPVPLKGWVGTRLLPGNLAVTAGAGVAALLAASALLWRASLRRIESARSVLTS
jgi:ABC-type Na+ efflux pump permease subunit